MTPSVRAARTAALEINILDKGILQSDADLDEDGISMEEALAYAYAGVMNHEPAPPEDQEPVISDMYLTFPDYLEELVP